MAEVSNPGTPRPRIAALLLLGWLASVALLLYEGASAPAQREVTQLAFVGADKLLHTAAWGWLSLLLTPGLMLLHRLKSWHAIAIAVAANSLIGIATEVVQLKLGAQHGRHADLGDLTADVAGSIIGALVAALVVMRLTRPERANPNS